MNDEDAQKRNRKKKAAAIVAVIIIVLVVWFLSIHHDIDVDVEGEGTVSPDGVTVGHLGSATLEFIPDEGWVLKEVLLDGKPVELDDGKLTLRWIVSDHNVKAVFVEATIEDRHTLTVTSSGNGSVSPSGTVSYPAGSEVSVTATPDDGYVIGDVKVDGQSVGSRNIVTVTMDSDRSVEVVFRAANDVPSGDTPADPWVDISVDVQVITTGADFGTVEPSGKVRVAYGGSLTVTIQLNEGYSLESVTADGVPMGKSTVVTVENVVADVDMDIVISHAVRTYTVTASVSSGGTITPNGGIEVIEGENVTFTISPNRGYRLSSLLVDGKSVGSGLASYTLKNVTADRTVRAVFESTSPGPTPQPVKTLTRIGIDQGQEVPGFCYVGDRIGKTVAIIAYYSDGSAQQQTGTCYPTSWDSPGTETVTVSYGGKTCTFELTVPTLSGIEITEQPSRTVFAVGETISLDGMVVTARYTNSQYDRTATGWTSSHQSFDTAGTQTVTITYIEGSRTVTASLEVTIAAPAPQTYQITATASSGGTISPSGTIEVTEGQDLTFTITPDNGYRLSSLTVDGASVGSGMTSYTVENVRKDVVVLATFESVPGPTPGRTLTEIKIDPSAEVPKSCYIGDSIGGTIGIIAHYSDGSTESRTGTCYPASWTTPGEKTVTVSYGGKTCTFDVTVPELSSIDITRKPSVTTFAKGDTISLDGMEITARYTDGQYDRTATGWTSSHQSFDAAGTQEVTISYTEGTTTVTATLDVTIVDKTGFTATVIGYSGKKVENGTVVAFDRVPNTRLSAFSFDMGNTVPGIVQTITVEVRNGTGMAQEACIYVPKLTGDDVLAQQIALHSGTSSSTVYEAADGSAFVDLGTIAHGKTVTFELTIEFVESEDNNQAMGKSLTFTLGVFAGQETG